MPKLLDTRRLGLGSVASFAVSAGLAATFPSGAAAFSGVGTPCNGKLRVKPGTDCVHGTYHSAYNFIAGYDSSNVGVCAGIYTGAYKCTLEYGPYESHGADFISVSCKVCVSKGYAGSTDVHNHWPNNSVYDVLFIAGP